MLATEDTEFTEEDKNAKCKMIDAKRKMENRQSQSSFCICHFAFSFPCPRTSVVNSFFRIG
jgi:hypothetical protein